MTQMCTVYSQILCFPVQINGLRPAKSLPKMTYTNLQVKFKKGERIILDRTGNRRHGGKGQSPVSRLRTPNNIGKFTTTKFSPF